MVSRLLIREREANAERGFFDFCARRPQTALTSQEGLLGAPTVICRANDDALIQPKGMVDNVRLSSTYHQLSSLRVREHALLRVHRKPVALLVHVIIIRRIEDKRAWVVGFDPLSPLLRVKERCPIIDAKLGAVCARFSVWRLTPISTA